VPLVAWSPKKY